jgi:hypothetical protein
VLLLLGLVILTRAFWTWHLDEVSGWLADPAEVHDFLRAEANAADCECPRCGFLPYGPHPSGLIALVLGGLVVAADVAPSAAEPACQLERTDDLSSGSAAVWAL